MSYNGSGLSSAKGAATSGHIQRNIGNLKSKDNEESKGKHYLERQIRKRKQEKIEKQRKMTSLEIDREILDHSIKREIEVKVMEYRDKVEDENPDWEDDKIDDVVKMYRIKLMDLEKVKQRKRSMRSYNAPINPFRAMAIDNFSSSNRCNSNEDKQCNDDKAKSGVEDNIGSGSNNE